MFLNILRPPVNFEFYQPTEETRSTLVETAQAASFQLDISPSNFSLSFDCTNKSSLRKSSNKCSVSKYLLNAYITPWRPLKLKSLIWKWTSCSLIELMVLNTKIALNFVSALTPWIQAALLFENWDTVKKFPLLKFHKVRLVETRI